MITIHVHVTVKPECISAFEAATTLNARESIKEPGVARFDLIRQIDLPTHFIIIEIYRSPDAQLRHKETKHYEVWRDTVAPMMATPRTSVKFENVFPAP